MKKRALLFLSVAVVCVVAIASLLSVFDKLPGSTNTIKGNSSYNQGDVQGNKSKEKQGSTNVGSTQASSPTTGAITSGSTNGTTPGSASSANPASATNSNIGRLPYLSAGSSSSETDAIKELNYLPIDPQQLNFSPLRNGFGEQSLCFSSFNPDVGIMKRQTALDAFGSDYSAFISNTNLEPLQLSPVQLPDTFTGSITVQFDAGMPVSIPSVSPDANILDYQAEPDVPVNFFKDGADNFYAESSFNGEVTLTFETSADPNYFTSDIPSDVTLDDIPAELKNDLPQQIQDSARSIIDQLGLTGENNISNIMDELENYFSGFTEGQIPTVAEEPDPYLAIAESQHGDSYERAFAFAVTANSLGLPTRIVQNEGHAFVETYIPTKGWEGIDLGGLGSIEFQNPNEYMPFDPSGSGEGSSTPTPGVTPTPDQTSGLTQTPLSDSTPTSEPATTATPISGQTPDLTPVSGSTLTPIPGSTLTPASDQTTDITSSPTPEPTSTPVTSLISVVTQTNITVLPADALKGSSFRVEGTVLDDAGTGVEGMTVEVFLNRTKSHVGGMVVGSGVTYAGQYAIDCTVPENINVGDYQVIAHAMEQVATDCVFKESWSDPSLRILTNTAASIDLPSLVEVNKSFKIAGRLVEEFGKPVAGEQIILYEGDSNPIGKAVTSKDGTFTLEYTYDRSGDHAVTAFYAGNNYYKASTSLPDTVDVAVPTNINLNTVGEALTGTAVVINGGLNDMYGVSVAGREVNIYVDSSLAAKVYTDTNGSFSINHTFRKAGIYQINAEFKTLQHYLGSTATVAVPVKAAVAGKHSFPFWIFAFVPVAGAGGLGGYVLLRRRNSVQAAPSKSVAIKAPPKKYSKGADSKVGLKTTMDIRFPEIEDQLPAVWGIAEVLAIEVLLSDSNNLPIPQKSVTVLSGQQPFRIIATDQKGKLNILHAFSQKGEHILSSRFKGDTTYQSSDATKAIRIVDYREEIIAIFKSLIDWANGHSLIIDKDATPREIQNSLVNKFNSIDHDALEKVIWTFEETDYSTHPVSRQQYKIMFFSARRVQASAEG